MRTTDRKNEEKRKSVAKTKACELTVCDSSQRLVEGGRVAVVGERDTHASGQEPSGQREGLLVLEQPRPEALVVDFVALPGRTGDAHRDHCWRSCRALSNFESRNRSPSVSVGFFLQLKNKLTG